MNKKELEQWKRRRMAENVINTFRQGLKDYYSLGMAGYSHDDIQAAISFGMLVDSYGDLFEPLSALVERPKKFSSRCFVEGCDYPMSVCLSEHSQIIQSDRENRPRLHYRGVSGKTGFRHWTGPSELVQKAKEHANAKLILARCRPNGGNGNFLLTIEDIPYIATTPTTPPESPEMDTFPVEWLEEEEERLAPYKQRREEAIAAVKKIKAEALAAMQRM